MVKVHRQQHLEKLHQILMEAPQQLQAEGRQILIEGARDIATDARAFAPLRTGFLRHWIWSRSTAYGAGVYSSAFYSYFVERGHRTAAKHIPIRFIPGQFFMKRAVDLNEPRIRVRLENMVLQHFERMTGGWTA